MVARDDQPDNPVCLAESNTIIKSIFKTQTTPDVYHNLTRQDQVIIFRLRTGHNRLNQHLYRKMKVVSSLLRTWEKADQDTRHILQDCGALQQLREDVLPSPIPLEEKLYSPLEALQATANFIKRSDLVWFCIAKKKKNIYIEHTVLHASSSSLSVTLLVSRPGVIIIIIIIINII